MSLAGSVVVGVRHGVRAVCRQEPHVRRDHDRELLEHRDLPVRVARLPHPRLDLPPALHQPLRSPHHTALLVRLPVLNHTTTVAYCRKAFNCRILYRVRSFMLLAVILIITSFPSPTHSFIPDSKPSFSANPSYDSPSFFFFRIHYMDSPDCLLLFLSKSVFYF